MLFGVFLGSAGESFALPECPGSYNSNTWTDCFGTYTDANGRLLENAWNGIKTASLERLGRDVEFHDRVCPDRRRQQHMHLGLGGEKRQCQRHGCPIAVAERI